MRGRANRPAEEADVDLTPMLDVVFILLIFFIVTSNFITEEALGLEPPPPPSDTPPPDDAPQTILILLDQDNLITINGRLSDIGAVRGNIERLRAESPDSSVIIQAHPQTDSGAIIRVRDQAKSANINAVNILLSQVQ